MNRQSACPCRSTTGHSSASTVGISHNQPLEGHILSQNSSRGLAMLNCFRNLQLNHFASRMVAVAPKSCHYEVWSRWPWITEKTQASLENYSYFVVKSMEKSMEHMKTKSNNPSFCSLALTHVDSCWLMCQELPQTELRAPSTWLEYVHRRRKLENIKFWFANTWNLEEERFNFVLTAVPNERISVLLLKLQRTSEICRRD